MIKYLTYFELRKKDKKFLWNYGVLENSIDNYAQKVGYDYFDKIIILEMLSVKHREWKF